MEAFIPEEFSALLKMNFLKKSQSNFVTRRRGGPALFINTEGGGDNVDLIIDYSAQVGYEAEQVHLWED